MAQEQSLYLLEKVLDLSVTTFTFRVGGVKSLELNHSGNGAGLLRVKFGFQTGY